MDLERANEFAKDWIEAWNDHDLERIISHYEKSLEFKSPIILERYPDSSGIILHRDKLREYFAIGLEKNPDLRFHLLEILTGTDSLVLYYENARGGKTAELFEFNERGKVVRSISCYR